MLCVNLNSPEFKRQAERNGVSESKLELIIHKYRILTNQEDGDPSDEYIQQELGNVMYQESSDNVIRLWRQEYNYPKEYETKEELSEAHEKAAQFFPESSIIHYVDNQGKYVLNIKEPVKDLSANNQSYRYTQEMMQIKRQAILDGNFMQAPNGKKSNLTERQWLQVRTLNFRNWFGDWLAYQKIKNATVVWGHPGTGKTYLYNQGRNDVIDFDSEYKSRLGDLKEREVLKRRIGKQAYNQELDKLFDEARQEAINSGRKLLVSDMHFLRDRSNDLDVVTNISDAEFIERSHQRGEHDEADKQEWKDSINNAMLTVSPDKVINTTGYIFDLLDGTDVSKVVDENGEPLVVYHGGPHDISAFKLPNNSVKISFDSTRNLEWAKQQGYQITQDVIDRYNNGEEVDVVKPVGVYFAADDVTARSYFGRRNEADTALYQVFLNIRNPHLANMNGKQMHDDSATVGLLKYAKDNSNDGVIIDDVRDYGPNDEERINWDTGHFAIEPTTDYIIFNSNQVKSATDNIGTFSTENNDIRYNIDYYRLRNHRKNLLLEIISQSSRLNLKGAYALVSRFNQEYGTNFGLTRTKMVTDKAPSVMHLRDAVSGDRSMMDFKQFIGLENFLHQLFPDVNCKVLAREQFDKFIEDNHLNVFASSFIVGDTIYLPDDMADPDVLLEEYLHPLVNMLKNVQYDTYTKLLDEAKHTFPRLWAEVQESYTKFTDEQRDGEILTQALARYFREDLGKDFKKHHKFREWCMKFIQFIRDIFGSEQLPEFRKNNIGHRVIEVRQLRDVNSLSDLTTILNTDRISFPTKEGTNGDITYHLENLDNDSLNMLEDIDNAIQTGNWTDEALEQLDNLIEEYNDGRNEITQILGRGLSETSKSSEAYAAASIITRRVQSSMRKSNDTLSPIEGFRARNRERRLKEGAIQQWAQENGWWWNDFAEGKFLDDYLTDEYGEVSAEGSESIVHISKDGKYVIKAMSAIASDGDLTPLLQKIELHNQIFPDTSLEILGFGRTKDGNFRIILQQPLIIGEKVPATEAEQALINELGVTNNALDYSLTLFEGKIILRDITNPENRGNILKDSEGNYFVIDADIAFNENVIQQTTQDLAEEDTKVDETETKKPRFLLKKETWQDRVADTTIRLLPYDQAQEVNRLLEQYMDKAGEGTVHETLADDFFSGKAMTVSEALDKIAAETEDRVIKRIAQLAKSKMGKAASMPVEYKGTESSLRGRYVQGVSVEHGGAVYIYQNATKGSDVNSARSSMQKTILHEIIHGITSDTIESNPRLQKEIAAIMRLLQDYIDSNNLVPKLYALKNEKEFVAEFMSRPELREAMKRMPSGDATSGNLWLRFVNWIKKALGLNRRTSLYNDADRVIKDILDNQAIEYFQADLAEENDNLNGWNIDRNSVFLNGKEYYVEYGKTIYTTDGRLALLPDRLKNQILVYDGLARGTANEVEYRGKKYVVFDDNRIVSLTTYNIMKWGPENGDRRAILNIANSLRNPQMTPSPSNSAQSERQETFTFNNGITVDAPFQPNPELVIALNAMADFVNDRSKKVMTLSGYAGTGKTSLMEMFADMMKKKRKSVKFSASTNKAAGELGKRVNKKGYKSRTLNKLFGIAVETDATKAYDTRNLINKIRDSRFLHYGDVVIIDEASMINELNYDTIMEIANNFDLKIIFVGDKGQLAPVKENEVSKVFRDKSIDVVTLSKVERTGDNAILKEATRSRNGENFSNESQFNNQGQGVAFISNKHRSSINDVIDHYVKGLKDNPDYFRILAYTNAAVARYNEYVRHLFGYDDAIPRVGEPMMGYANWGYVGGEYRFVNSESYKVLDVKEPIMIKRRLAGVSGYIDVEVEATPIILEDSAGKKDIFNLIDITRNEQNREVVAKLAEEKDKLWRVARTLRGWQRAEIQEKISNIEEFLFVNDVIKSQDGRWLQGKVIDFGYAMTTHKSQGSTFTHVLIDDVDIVEGTKRASGTGQNMANAVVVPDLGPNEVEQDMSNAALTNTEDIDLGDLSGVEDINAKEYGNLSTRQRLEYVAVSRATDTATIITDNVTESNEDSPLNHIGVHAEPVMSDAMKRSIELVNQYYQKLKQDYSATDFTLSKLAPQEHYEGDYSYATKIANNTKDLVTDYFNTMFKKADGTSRMSIEQIDNKQYGNIGQKLKREILADLERLKNWFNETYGEGQYLVTTTPIRTTGTFNYNGTEATVAGMTDIILIDKDGGIHMYNLRTKNFSAKDIAHNGMSGIQFILNGVRQLFEQGTGAKVEDVSLIWFEQKYPEQSYPGHPTDVTYTTDRSTGMVTVTDLSEQVENIPLSEYSRWETPHLAENIEDSIIPVEKTDVLNTTKSDVENTAINRASERSNKLNSLIAATIAPYFKTTYEDYSKMSPLELSRMRNSFASAARNIALALGIDANFNEASFNIGGYEFDDGGNIIEPSFTFRLNTTPEKARLFAALMGDLGFEQLETTISNQDVATAEEAGEDGGIRFAIRIDDYNKALELINQYGIKNFSYDKTRKTLSVLSFDINDVQKFHDLVKQLKKEGYEQETEQFYFKGYADGKTSRETLYKEWLDSEEGKSSRGTELYNFVQEALSKVSSQELESTDTKSLDKAPIPEIIADNSPINIWSREHNGYEGLSNLAQRPFTLDGVLIQRLCGMNGMIPNPAMHNALVRYLHEKSEPVQINSVENLFQAMKVFYSDKYLTGNAREARLTDEGKRIFEQILNESPSVAKRDGGRHGIVKELKLADWNSESKSIMEVIARYSFDANKSAKELLLSTGNRQLTHTQGDNIWREAFPAVLMKIRGEYLRAQADSLNTTSLGLTATIAPYAKTEVTAENFNTVKNNVEQEFKRQALEIAHALGLSLEDKDISTNIESMENMEGNTVDQVASQLSYTFNFSDNTDIDKIKVFAALMADLGYEQQESATVMQYVAEDDVNFNAMEYAVTVNNLRGVLPMLEQFGFTDFTVNNTRKEVTVLISENDRSIAETTQMFERFIQELINQNNYDTRRTSRVQVEKLGREARRKAYTDYSGQRAIQQLQDGLSENRQSQALTTMVDNALSMLFDKPVEQQFTLDNYVQLTQQETPEVDADWKKPLLRKLDNELDVEKSYEANASVFDIISKVLTAESETEAREIMSEQQRKQERELDNYDKLTSQIDNIYNSDKLQLSEIRHIAELAMNAISDEITKLQTDAEEKNRMFPELKTDLDFTKASRRQIIDAVGINTLLEYAKKLFDPSRYDDIDTMWQAWDIMDNWDGIIQFGSDVFVLNEGFGINKNFDSNRYETNGKQSVGLGSEMYGDADAMPTDMDGVAENGSKQEHWQVEFRTIDTVNDLINNIFVKRAIHDCYLKDENGNVIMSKWGIPERVPVRDAVQSILHWVQGANGLAEMITNLEAHRASNRWLDSLIEKLRDSNESTMQSQFTGVFWKPFQLMGVVTYDKKKGKYISKPVNRHPALSETLNRIKVDFQAAMHPLFIGYGKDVRVNMDYLGTEESAHDLFDKNKPITLRRALAYLKSIKEPLIHNKNAEFTKEMAEESIPYLTAACRMLGFYVDENLVRSAVMMTEVDAKTGQQKYNREAFMTMSSKLFYIVDALDKAVVKEKSEQENPTPDYAGYDPFKFRGENSILGSLTDFLTPVTNQLEDTYNSSVYDSGKMYQSYVIPSPMTLLMNKLKDNTTKANNLEQEFITDFYGKSEWFGVPGAGGRISWRNEMLKELALNPKAREIFEHKVQLNFNKHNFMRTMSPQEQTLALIAEYYAERNDTGDRNRAVAWYKIPMESNKPSAEYIKFWSYRGEPEVYKANITRDLFKMFLQELSRIQTVRMRNKVKGDEGFIENWDVNGRKFCFLPFFNEYLNGNGTLLQNVEGYTAEDDKALAQEIKERLNGENVDFSLADEFHGDSNGRDAKFVKMVKDAINYFMEQRTNAILDSWEKEGILQEAKKIENVRDPRKDAENYIWNHYLMAKNILQLTIGDIAFYKDTEDLQKRLAQLHSPGIRGNKYATWNGEQVSDGFYRTVIAKDLRKQVNFHSNLIANLTEVLDKKIEDAPEEEKEGWRMLKDSLVGKDGLYRDVNVTDAQAYSSPTSYRKKAIIFGKWSDEAETIYNKLIDGTATLSDIRIAFQPLKPFVYGLLEKNLGVDEAPITTMLEPFQAKNSEYLLFMADALLQNEETSQPNLLRAIYQVMEDSYFVGRERDADGKIIKNGTYTGRGIDTIQFESAIKSSLQGAIDIGEHWNDIDGEAEVIKMLEDRIYMKDANGNILRDQYNEMTYVHKLDYDNYCIQQEVPEHFRDHDQTHGSQIRMITHSDLDYYYDPNGDLSDPANVVMYEVKDYDKASGKFVTKKLTASEFKREYEGTIADNLDHSYERLVDELQLDGTKKERNLALSKILRREILNSPRYGIDLLLACTVDKEGNFRIPKGDPIQAKRIEQLCNSIIKNRLNKQEIAGGPIVQVTNFGTRRLSVVFKDKFTGGLLLTEDQWNQKVASGEELPKSMTGKTYGSYSEYIDGRQGGIAHFECFAPAWSREIFDKFTRSDGTIDIEAIDKLDPDLLKMVGYRIPTEDKYSCAPLKIVGFLPAIAGEAIMMPYELTTINDSDFDVDKEYVMRKVIYINVKNDVERIARDIWMNVPNVSYANASYSDVLEFVKNPEEFKGRNKFYDILWDAYIKYAYYTAHPKEGTLYRNNKIVDMTYEVLSHETNVLKVLKPGGFDNLKKPAYLIEAYKLNVNNDEYKLNEQEFKEVETELAKTVEDKKLELVEDEWNYMLRKKVEAAQHKKAWDELSKLSMDELKKLCETEKDLAWVDTEIQFYRQNAAAASLIGVQAVNKVAHAVLEGDGFHIDVGSLCGDFVIGDKSFSGYMEVDKTYNDIGELIGKTLGSSVSASADAAKYPIYNLVNVNMATVNIMNTLLRLGMPDAQVFKFMSQDVITRTIEEYNKANLTGNASFAGTVELMIEQIKKKNAPTLSSDSQLFSEGLTNDEMIEGILPVEHPEIDLKVLNIVQKLLTISNVIRNLDHPTRFNSISSAVGPLIIDNLIAEYKINKFTVAGAGEGGTHIFIRYNEDDLTEEDRYILNNPDTPDNHPLKLGFKQADFFTVLGKHPILAGFYRGLDIAKRLFKDMPAGSDGFRKLLDSLPENVQDSIFNDKKLLDKLCMFYQTYMLVAAGLLNPGKKGSSGKTEFESYIKGFPKWFMEIEKSEEYRRELDLDNNPFVKAIQYDMNSDSGNFYLKMNLTGLDTQVKQALIDGWVDLFKKGEKGKDLATKLMIYNIYRGGIGFSPRTFTALISTYLKENFSGKDRDGNEVRYRDIFDSERWPAMNNEMIFDQFVRNNWDDYRLVKDMSKAKRLGIDYSKGELTVATDYRLDGSKDDFMVKEMKPYKYITTERYLQIKDSEGKSQSVRVTLLWRRELDSDNVLVYKLTKPLGNNGEYIEMDVQDIKNPLTDTYTVMPLEESSTLPEKSQTEKEVSANEKVDAVAESQKEKNFNTVKDKIIERLVTNNRLVGKEMTLADAERRLEEIKQDLRDPSNRNRYRKFLHNLLTQAGIEVNVDNVIEKFLEFC